MAATPEFYTLKRLSFEGDQEAGIPSFVVPELCRLPDEFQSYPKVRRLPDEILAQIFDARDPVNDVTDHEDPLVSKTALDSIMEGRRPKRSGALRRPATENPTPGTGSPEKSQQGAPGGLSGASEEEARASFKGSGIIHQAVDSLVAAGYDLAKARAADPQELLDLPGVGPGTVDKLK